MITMSKSTLCFLCKTESSCLESYDINSACTTYSKTVLNKYIEKIFKQKVIYVGWVCANCFKLFDELDLAEKKVIDITAKLCSYLNCSSKVKCNAYAQTEVQLQTDFEQKVVFSNTFNDDPKMCVESVQLKEKDSRQYECRICLKKFISKNGMTLHCRKLHAVNSSSEVLEKETNISHPKQNNNDEVKKEFENGDLHHNKDLRSYTANDKINNCEQNLENNKVTKIRECKKTNSGVIKPYMCTKCPKTWKTTTELKHHMMSHDNSRPYICEICGQAYKHKTALNIHVGMHNGINPFTCLYCNKSFTQKGALQRHIPMHTGETPFQCDLCGKRFVHHTSFNIHRLSHSGQKSYKCDICNLALLSGSHLKRHMRVHTGERKYACAVCDKRFAERYNLVSHQKLHSCPSSADRSSKRNHRCQVCGQSFIRKTKLDDHMVNYHEKAPLSTPSNTFWLSPHYSIKEESVSSC